MGTTAIPDAIDWLVDTCRAAATLGTADPPVLVFDGPQPADTSPGRLLWIGASEVDLPEATESAAATQEWAGLGAMRKNDLLSIPCVARGWSGDEDFRGVRRAAFEVLGAVEDIVRANASLGGTVLVTLPGITNVRYRQALTDRGALADIGFDIAAKARI